VNELNKANN